jgi:hypothetical protein
MVNTVVRYCTLAFLTWAITSCTNETSDNVPQDDSLSTVTASDTANATAIPLEDARIRRLTLRYEPREVYRYRIVQSNVITQDTIASSNSSTYTYTKTVNKVLAGGAYEVSMRIDSVQATLTVRSKNASKPLVNNTFNSTDTAKRRDPQYASMAALVGTAVRITIDTMGKVTDIVGTDSIVGKIVAAAPGGANATKQEREMLSQQIEQGVFGSFAGQEFVPYPDAEIDSTLSWTREQNIPIPPFFEAHSIITYRIENVKNVKGRRLATIVASIQGVVRPVAVPNDAPVTITTSGSKISGDSRAVIDLDKGFTISKKNNVRMLVSGTVTRKESGQKETFKQEQESTFSVELLP